MAAALEQFKESLELSSALRKLENDKFSAIPRQEEQPFVKGLRGGAAVLMVAAFEFFLKRLFEENISKLNAVPVNIDFEKLPDNLKVKTVFHSLKRAMDGPLFETKPPKKDRIKAILDECKLLITQHINPYTFSETGSNPNSKTVREKFKDVGIDNVFTSIKVRFEKKWKQSVPNSFIADKLDEIVSTRHVVAHTANTLHISRSSQNEALKFLSILAEVLEKELEDHINLLQKNCKK